MPIPFGQTLQSWLRRVGLDVRRTSPPVPGIPDAQLYHPTFEAWSMPTLDAAFAPALERSLVTRDRLYVLYRLLAQALAVPGDVIECGVYRGGTARMLGDLLTERGSEKRLYVCDTFEGMPETDAAVDLHRRGDFSQTSLESVRAFLSGVRDVVFVPGTIPESLRAIPPETKFCFAHIDLDIYNAVRDASRYVYDRLTMGGFIIYDDYGFASCPGARRAVDEFYEGLPEQPLVLSSGQCVVFRSA